MRLIPFLLCAAMTAPLAGCGILDSDSSDDDRRGQRTRYEERDPYGYDDRSGDRYGDEYRRDEYGYGDRLEPRRNDRRVDGKARYYSREDLVLIGSVRTRGREQANDLLEIKGKQRFKGLLFEVDQGEVVVEHIRVTFDDDTAFEPNTATRFRAGEQTRVIDLPGNNRDVKRVRVKYRSVGGQPSVIDVLGLPATR